MPTWLIWVIVIVVVLVLIAALVSMTSKRRTVQRHERAEQLRQEASTRASGLAESQRQAEELRAKADLAQTEAERLEERAADAEQGHRIEQAGYEDKLREADRLDPEVDHKARDYEPDVWDDERSESTTAATPSTSARPETTGGTTSDTTTETTQSPTSRTDETTTGARHAASPEDTSVAQRAEDPEAEATSTERRTAH
jgi:hypothetical protein